VLKVFGERAGSEAPVAANVETSQKNHERHKMPPFMTSISSAACGTCHSCLPNVQAQGRCAALSR